LARAAAQPGAVVLMMSGVGLVAAWIPARQALRLDPAQILRS
jgi:ABC-type antimicrobial peptide transport system permease subunit